MFVLLEEAAGVAGAADEADDVVFKASGAFFYEVVNNVLGEVVNVSRVLGEEISLLDVD